MKKMDMKFKPDIKKIVSIVAAVFLLAAHVGMILLMTKVIRYYAMYPTVFNYLIVILICLFIIIDIVFFVGFLNKDMVQKGICIFMAILIAGGSIFGTVLMGKTNQIVDNVVQSEDEEQYETVNGVFVTYSDKYASVGSVTDLSKFSGITIGGLIEADENGITSIGLEDLKLNNVTSYSVKTYNNNTELLFALIGGEVDVAIFSSMYKAIFRADENVDYTQYLDQMNEFGEFSKDIVVASNASRKDLSKDPFNVLLIGWSPVEGSTTIGLADAIIVATVNPQTYTVSMMSIARDSYVPITCYGGQCDKINSGRGTSMDCFVSTVETLIGEEIDFYMETNFAGFAILVDCLGGVEINNPISFELDGIYVPEGSYVANGWQALEFARERHHMPNGDFDRQQHQKEVIMQIAKKFIKHDLAFALDIFEEIAAYLNTNMTFNQLASVFNMITGTKNYTGVSTFTMLDMHALRMTGYGSWHYNDSYELPLWIYKLYDGSISESLNHMQEVMGNFKTINQDSGFAFNADSPYVRPAFYSTEYDEVENHEDLPPYYINLTSMTYQEALAWAKTNGATLIPSFIDEDDDGYDEALDGYVVSQSVAYGKKVSKYPSCSITVMGNGKKKVTPPDFEDWNLERAVLWCKDNEVAYTKVAKYIKKSASAVSEMVVGMDYNRDLEIMTITYTYVCGENSAPNLDGTACTCDAGYKDDGTGTCSLFVTVPNITTSSEIFKKAKASSPYTYEKLNYKYVTEYSRTVADGSIISISPTPGTSVASGSTVTITVSKGVNPDEKQVPNVVGKSASDAKSAIEAAGLVYAADSGVYSTTTRDVVLAQSKSSGEWVAKGSTITVTLSLGQEPCDETKIPDGSGGCTLKAVCQTHQTYNSESNTCSWDTGYAEGGCAEGYESDGDGGCKLKASSSES